MERGEDMSGCDYMNPRFRVAMDAKDGKTKCERCKNYGKQDVCDKCTAWRYFVDKDKDNMQIELRG